MSDIVNDGDVPSTIDAYEDGIKYALGNFPVLSPNVKGIIYRVLLHELIQKKEKMDAFEGVVGKENRRLADQEIARFLEWLKTSAGY